MAALRVLSTPRSGVRVVGVNSNDFSTLLFMNCVKTIYVCDDYRNNTIEPIVLPKNAENFLNTEAEYLRYCHDWEDGMSI